MSYILFFRASVRDKKLRISSPSTMLPYEVILYVRCLWFRSLLSRLLKPASKGINLHIYYWKSRKLIYVSLSFMGHNILIHPSSLAMYGIYPLFFILFTILPIWKSHIFSALFGLRSNTIIFWELSAINALGTSPWAPYLKICTSFIPHLKL